MSRPSSLAPITPYRRPQIKLKEGDLLDFIPNNGSFPLRGEVMEGGFIHVQSDTGAELFNPDQILICRVYRLTYKI